MIPIRLYLYAAAAIGLLALAAYAKWTHDRLAHWKGRAQVVEATLTAERTARAHELKIANEASNAYQAELRRIRAEPSIGSVRICPARRVPAASTAASGSDAGPAGRVEGEVEGDREPSAIVDVGPALDSYGSDCEATAAQLSALQSWVRSR